MTLDAGRAPQRTTAPPIVAATVAGSGARIVIVDDEAGNLRVMERLLSRAGYQNVDSTSDPRRVVDECAQAPPDLMLLDLHMPGLDGFGVLSALRTTRHEEGHFPVIVLTADVHADSRLTALAAGADDFITKPLEPIEALLRVRNLVATHQLRQSLLRDRSRLEETVQERTVDLELARTEILEHLALASEYRDDDTHEHARRIGQMSATLARAAGLAESVVELLERAASLHDIGKLAVPDSILLKPGPLDPDEFAVMQQHTIRGAEILGDSRSPLLQLAEVIARSHHERWNGTGYPLGLAGEDIPVVARVVTLVDVFDALTHERPYKRAWSISEALAEMARGAGTQFDPALLALFLQLDHHALFRAKGE